MYQPGMCGAELFPAGRGKDENPWGGVGGGEDENPRGSPGRGEKARKSTDLKIRQKCVNCYWRICITVWCFDQGKHYILWLLNGLSANQIITSCTKDQMNSFSFISFSSPFLAQMCEHNLCNLQSALPRCAPRVLSISAGRGGVGWGEPPWLVCPFTPLPLHDNCYVSYVSCVSSVSCFQLHWYSSCDPEWLL